MKLNKKHLKKLTNENAVAKQQTPIIAGGVGKVSYGGCTASQGDCAPNTYNDGTCMSQSPDLTGCACPTTSPNICN
ncbi:hypothetical protein [Pseudoalteromonas luteoviolacea]|uniref:Uncharacterized protein n=1 Tax=Pseudoalteromonas luteoviolacea DSM 6061 TaxID=1365250 RepID=A0A161XSY5_9GAMM|nr:hypothetical protein [Pseudoalteromonas luteoviolacea]KZN29671.1 hypothetical protein N475_05080 [Pseudoalteromonas luteoviolacea DSM 6061]KZN53231.1 hypothetical protein N474_21210 [Pseudoalteromonas luteoviolacea CPMOR-2]MBE0389439.1 hypothetical protein [Pseudoalteromonas luteoviolacea DSM 6061]TQF67887.1 hypothetical protein FLM44_22170 [Pseudoalteromonas luteoviolacea]